MGEGSLAAWPRGVGTYLRSEGKDAILERVQLAGAENAHVARLATAEAKLLVAAEVGVEMAEDTCRLNLDRSYVGDRLDVNAVLG